MKINKTLPLLLLLLLGLPNGAYAFYCTALGKAISGGTANVYVNLEPSVQVGQRIAINLGNSISCENDVPSIYLDPVRIMSGQFSGALSHLSGGVEYFGVRYDFPLTAPTHIVNHTWGTLQPWQTILYFNLTGTLSPGIAVNAGEMIAVIKMEKMKENISGSALSEYTWNIYANNTVVVPTASCEVSSRNVTVVLPDYPGTVAVPLTTHCTQNQRLSYYLTGTTTDNENTIFSNTSSSDPATGVGVQLSNRNGVIATNQNVSLGTIGSTPTNLGLSASYARTGGQVVAGNVQSIIGVTFIYE